MASESAPEPTNLGEAEAQLDRAYRELGGTRAVEGGRSTGATTKAEPAGGVKQADKAAPESPPPPSPPRPAPPAADMPMSDDRALKTGKKDAASEEQDEAAPCRQACRAYASLRRAVDAVCRLAGDPSEKCTSARDRQKEIEGRVTSCGCGLSR